MKYLLTTLLLIFAVACSSSDSDYHFEQGFFETNEDFGNRIWSNVRPVIYDVSVKPHGYNNMGSLHRALKGVESRVNTLQSLYFEFYTKPIKIKGKTNCKIDYTAHFVNTRTQETIHVEILTSTSITDFAMGTHNYFMISRYDREIPINDRMQIVIKCNNRAVYNSSGTFPCEMFFGQYPISVKL